MILLKVGRYLKTNFVMQNRFMHGGEVEATQYFVCFYGQSSNHLLITLNVTWINSSSEKGVCH